MQALLRPAFVLGLSIAIAATTLLGGSSVALAATKPAVTSLSISSPVFEGDRPTITGTFTDPDATDQHALLIGWGDGSTERFTLPVGDRSFSLQKSIAYPENYTDLFISVELSDGLFFVNKFLTLTVSNAAPSVTSFSLSPAEVDLGQTVTATGGFDDPGTADTHTVTVDWGDRSTPTTLNLARRVWTFTTPAHTYGAAGTFTVTATVADDDGESDNATASVIVNGANTPPRVVSFGVTAGSEGGGSGLSLTFADADPSDTHTVSVAWGDGSSSAPELLASSVTTHSATHVYADNGTYAVVLTLEDSAHNTVTRTEPVSPTNVAPTVGSLAVSPASVVDHQTLTLTGSFTDPGTADTFTLVITWGDGGSSTESFLAGMGTRSFSATHAYDSDGPATVVATVEDNDHGTSSSSLDLVVMPSNHAPADLELDPTAVLEGGTTTLTVSFTDAESTDTHTVAINWGDTSSENVSLAAGATTASATHKYLETDSYALAVTVTDGRGMSVAGGTTIDVGNVAPSFTSLSLSPSSVKDHETVTLNGSFTDPGTADTFTVSVDWGDHTAGATESIGAGAARSVTASHAYSAAGTYVVTVTVTDRDMDTATQTTSVVVGQSNRNPSALSLNPTVNGSSVVVSATFTDPDMLDSHTATIDWGDETTTLTLAVGARSFVASHGYASSGTYTVSATVTDESGGLASATVPVVVTVSAGNAAQLLDQMKMLVQSFELDRSTERWLVRRIDELKRSLSNGNAQLCNDLKILAKVAAYGSRSLSSSEWAAVNALAEQLETAAQCPAAAARRAQSEKKTVARPVTPPTSTDKGKADKERADKERADKDKAETAKADKEKADAAAKAASPAKPATSANEKQDTSARQSTNRSGRSD